LFSILLIQYLGYSDVWPFGCSVPSFMPNYEQPQSFSRLSIIGHSSSDCRIVRRIWWMPNRCPSLPEYSGCVVENDAARSVLFGGCIGFYTAGRVCWWLPTGVS